MNKHTPAFLIIEKALQTNAELFILIEIFMQ